MKRNKTRQNKVNKAVKSLICIYWEMVQKVHHLAIETVQKAKEDLRTCKLDQTIHENKIKKLAQDKIKQCNRTCYKITVEKHGKRLE